MWYLDRSGHCGCRVAMPFVELLLWEYLGGGGDEGTLKYLGILVSLKHHFEM